MCGRKAGLAEGKVVLCVFCNSGLSQSYGELWNRDGHTDMSSIRQRTGLTISQVIDEDGFRNKGSGRDVLTANTLDS